MQIEIDRLAYTYPKTGFSVGVEALTLHSGVCAALCGENGSGKTTLGKLVTGLIRPDSGRVLYDGQDIRDWPLGKIGEHVGYLFQNPATQIFAPVVLEELTFAPVLRGAAPEAAESRALEALDRFELSQLSEHSTFTLSQGEKQRLAICALMTAGDKPPGFLALDEPTTGLDARRKQILGDTLDGLLAGGTGILLISHDDAFVKRHAQSRHILREGRLARE